MDTEEKGRQEIFLKGGQTHVTQDENQAYQVLTGHVLVYIIPYDDEKNGRRYLICEAQEGDIIPSMKWSHKQVGNWRFLLVALEEAALSVYVPEQMDEIKTEFAKAVGVRLFSADEFEEQMAEQYNINIIKEEGYIYATSLEQEKTYEKSLSLIYDMFRRKTSRQNTPESGNLVYDTVAKLCDHMRIYIAPFEMVKESCKRKFDIYDIARLSHFICREIVLEEKWFRKDIGPILAYTQAGRKPVACIPKGPNRYIAYDLHAGTRKVIDEAYALQLNVKADMLYRPFPAKELKWQDLMKFGFQGAYKRDFVSIGVLALLGTLIGLLLPVINQQLYDKFIPMADKTGLVQICFVILACTLGNLCFSIVKNLATFRGMNSMEYAVQSATYDRLFNLPESFFREYESADLAQRAMGISSIFQVCADVAVKTILSAAFSLMYLWRMFKYSKELSKFSVIMVLIVMLVVGYIGFRQTRYEEEKMELDGKISSIMYQFLNGISKIRIAGVENRALYEYLKPYARSRKIYMRKERMGLLVNAIVMASQVFFSIVLYYTMIRKSVNLSVGSFMAFMTAFGSFSGAMLEMVSSFLDVNSVIPAYKRCKPILKTLPEFEEDTVLPGTLSGDIEVSNVTFSYSKDADPVLTDLSFHIKEGEYIGIVGSSGCGKSTMLKLLLGFEKPQQGKIFYDGKDIDSMDKRELRKKFGVVLQDGNLISGSIYENITITSPNATMKRVEQVIADVGLKEDIAQMPMGLHTVLSENSGTISGGQQQRILIARAIVGKPRILFFDEATSALDNITQSMVCDSLSRLKVTRLVIAHRLSTVMDCDRIFVMDKGKIVEMGNFQELMDKKGLFYQLANRQMA